MNGKFPIINKIKKVTTNAQVEATTTDKSW
jgi:hypothetical protein